ncbi:MAG: chromosome segregation protein SMC [Bdellovibrionales bacterium]|nr:chromosome segregation protein SMC [Bdellovibrionales bacterium]
MRIRKLELTGFKSFKDKTVIHYDDGITGIVGPNGCGKSNVVDAFFWVMGEQNARLLRGTAMDDLIFSGSDKSPPASFAEVTLVLDLPGDLSHAPAGASAADTGTPTREVAITRKLYRTGESEYFLNKTPCRLKDIQELFMDTGAGARGYSIIQQGQIAKIVQMKPEDRRTMIEEVAGIMKYKARRKESMRKLEGTQQNLLRVTDVISELDGQKRMMERQAEKARKYKEWKDKLQDIELRFNALKWEDFSGRMGALEREIEDLSARELAATTARETAENQVTAKRAEATHAQNVADECRNKFFRLGNELNSSETEHKFAEKTREDAQIALTQLEADAASEEALLASLRAQNENLQMEASTILESFQAAESRLHDREQAAQEHRSLTEGLERDSEAKRKALFSAQSELDRSRNQVTFAERRLQEISEEMARLSTLKAERDASVAESLSLKNQASQQLTEARARGEETRQTISRITQHLSETRQSLEAGRKTLSRLGSDQARLATTLGTLEDQKRRHEGSSAGVKAVFQRILPQNDAWKQNVLGTLADFLRVEKGFEVAAETALRQVLDTVLTRNAELQLDLASALKQDSSGRATFVDLASLGKNGPVTTPDGIPEEILGHVLGSLRSYVNLQDQWARDVGHELELGARKLLELYLQNVFVVEDRAAAHRLAAQHAKFSFVTRDGELFAGGWLLEGGDLSSVSGSYVGRNREIEDLRTQVGSLDAELSSAQRDVGQLENLLAEKETEKRALEEDLRNQQARISHIASEEAGASSRLQEAERSLAQIASDVARREQDRQRIAEEESQARARALELEGQVAELDLTQTALVAELAAARASSESLQQQVVEARVQFSERRSAKDTIERRVQEASQQLQQHEGRRRHLADQMARRQGELESTSSRIVTLLETIERLRAQVVEADGQHRQSRHRFDELQHELDQQMNAVQEESKVEREVKDLLASRRLDMERAHAEREGLSLNTFERYGVTLAEYSLLPEVIDQVQLLRGAGDEHVNEIQNEVNYLKEKIRKLGEVNTGAIEEYDAIVTRWNFLSAEKADLEKSMADLQSTVDRINKVSKERFIRAFEEVNTHFRRVFPVIFGGGHAHLTLTNPEDLLETGVDITAQPPGKKPQNINLLSGGEKTLTAISLLFAIFLVKPSPFCLLDEVDAPLDDANIGRFNALLKEMAKRSQFIIITHNKRTMELNDKLYGVTMEDAGVSKMVSIQLTAAQGAEATA